MKKIITVISMLLIILGVYSRNYEHSRLVSNKYEHINEKLPSSFHGEKIIHFSDFLYPNTTNVKKLEKVVSIINEEKPLIIIFSGNLINKDYPLTEKELKDINKTFDNISIKTNLFYLPNKNKNDSDKEILEKNGFLKLTKDHNLIFYKENNPIFISNFENKTYNNNDFKISVTNKADEALISEKIDLVLAGNTFGGYIDPAISRPIFLKDGSKTFYKGEYIHQKQHIIVSNGIGTDKLKLRFNNKPSINIITLKNH